ncbi:hypothetical protein QTP70_030817 [Hemibagrus guttatus]|uniref:Uncharacterized protein n=1 Tax=Hemibagrus guttatus TaxID=175788 RepID=A0AAE0RLI0_9TELE|nr:hypothetical protein QTP70_030817 [Hemibagrus guttatus]
MLRAGPAVACMACRSLLPSRLGGIRFGVPLQKLHSLSRAIHHRYSTNNNPPQRHYTSLSRLPMRPSRSRSGHGYYQQHRSFWVARLAGAAAEAALHPAGIRRRWRLHR